ncbi:MAG: 3-deoxy-D-manno-octulosonic acid transferase [Ferruginibacter sp.]
MYVFYRLGVILYDFGIRLAATWQAKARLFVQGRKAGLGTPFTQKTIWMHCASLGEFEQGRPVLEALKSRFPGYPVVVSFFSPSGYEVRKNYALADRVVYLPLDHPANAQKTVEIINPAIVLWVKYDYWFCHLQAISKQHIPLLLIAAYFRNDHIFFRWYGAWWRGMLRLFHTCFVQNQTSAVLLQSIGLKGHAIVAGDTRFDRVITIRDASTSLPVIESITAPAWTLVAGSTWPDDESILFAFTQAFPEIRLIIAPHDVNPDRLRDLTIRFTNHVLYSQLEQGEKSVEPGSVIIIDRIGLLSRLYRYGQAAYVGGGFNRAGIHNILEAAVYGLPVIFGPTYQRSAEAKDLIQKGCAFSVQQATELIKQVGDWKLDENIRQETGNRAMDYVQTQAGATATIIDYVAANRLLTN